MRARARLEFQFTDDSAAEAALAGLSHERDVAERSRMTLSRKGAMLWITIESEDAVALRASANACLRALQVFEDADKGG